MQTCRISGNAEERPPNVTHRQRQVVGLSYTDFPHLFFVTLFSHNRHSRVKCKHFDKKDTFSHLGKTLTDRRFLTRWHNSPPFRRSANTRNFSINSKSIKNEQTTTANFFKSPLTVPLPGDHLPKRTT